MIFEVNHFVGTGLIIDITRFSIECSTYSSLHSIFFLKVCIKVKLVANNII
jgi:hypothetical protein